MTVVCWHAGIYHMRSDCFESDDTKLILMTRLFLSEVDCFCVDTLTSVSATVGSMSHTVFCVLEAHRIPCCGNL